MGDDKLNESESSDSSEVGSSIQLGLAEVVSRGVTTTKPEPSSVRQVDPLRALADAGDFRGLLNIVEPLVEAAPQNSLDAAKIWWLRASVKLGTPEQFLLGAIAEVDGGSVARAGELGSLVRESLVEFHSAGAVLLASELSRVLEASFPGSSSVEPTAGSSRFEASANGVVTSLKSADTADSVRFRETSTVGSDRFSATVIVVLCLLIAAAGIAFYGLKDSRGPGEISPIALTIPKDPPLSAPALAPAAPPSVLDKVLVSLDDRRRGSDTKLATQVKGAPSSQGASSSMTSNSAAAKINAINWDLPLEPSEVREAIAAGDPFGRADEQEEKNARRLFGDPQPVTKDPSAAIFGAEKGGSGGASAGTRDRLGRRLLDRLVEYKAVVRTIASREPKFTSPRVRELEEGEHVFVDMQDGPFLRIRLPSGGFGYVLSQDLEEVSD